MFFIFTADVFISFLSMLGWFYLSTIAKWRLAHGMIFFFLLMFASSIFRLYIFLLLALACVF